MKQYLHYKNSTKTLRIYKSSNNEFLICSYKTAMAIVSFGKVFKLYDSPSSTTSRHLTKAFQILNVKCPISDFHKLPIREHINSRYNQADDIILAFCNAPQDLDFRGIDNGNT